MHIHLLLALVLTVLFLPVLAFAEDSTPSYSMKKQGRVPFSSEQTADTDQTDDAQPSEIEPAAGADDEDTREPSESSSLQDNMRLPRKN